MNPFDSVKFHYGIFNTQADQQGPYETANIINQHFASNNNGELEQSQTRENFSSENRHIIQRVAHIPSETPIEYAICGPSSMENPMINSAVSAPKLHRIIDTETFLEPPMIYTENTEVEKKGNFMKWVLSLPPHTSFMKIYSAYQRTRDHYLLEISKRGPYEELYKKNLEELDSYMKNELRKRRVRAFTYNEKSEPLENEDERSFSDKGHDPKYSTDEDYDQSPQ